MAELTTDDGSTASPEVIRRFEERNNAVTDQTTDYLSGAKTALWNAHVAYQGVRPQSESDWLDALLAAAAPLLEDKGRSEERERLRQVPEPMVADLVDLMIRVATKYRERDELTIAARAFLKRAILASLDSDQEAR